jgi:hypothetical protein
VHSALNPSHDNESALAIYLAGQGNEDHTLPVGTATRGRRTNVAEARSMGEVRVCCRSWFVRGFADAGGLRNPNPNAVVWYPRGSYLRS